MEVSLKYQLIFFGLVNGVTNYTNLKSSSTEHNVSVVNHDPI